MTLDDHYMLAALYDPATGEIRRQVAGSFGFVLTQQLPGQALLEIPLGTIFSDSTHFVDLSGDEPVLALKP